MDEQKLIQTAVVQSEERLRSVLAHTAFAIYKRNLLTDQYDYVSQAFFAIVGYEPQEVEGQQLENLLAMPSLIRLRYPNMAGISVQWPTLVMRYWPHVRQRPKSGRI